MSISLRKHAAMFLAATFTVGSMATFGAAALDQPTAVLSSTLNHSVGTVLTSAEISMHSRLWRRQRLPTQGTAGCCQEGAGGSC